MNIENSFDLLLDRPPRREQRDRRQEAGEDDQQQADAVDADGSSRCRTPGSTRARSTNWKSADAGSKPRPQQQRHARTPAARRRARSSGSSPSCGRRRLRNEQQQQRADERQEDRRQRVRSGIRCTSSSADAGSSRDQHEHAEEQRARRRRAPSRSAASRSRPRAPPRTIAPVPFTAPSMHAGVDDLQSTCSEVTLDRLHDGRVVDLVHVVLVQQQPVQARELRAPTASAARRLLQEEERREADAARARRRSTTAHQRPSLDAGVPASASRVLRAALRRAAAGRRLPAAPCVAGALGVAAATCARR